jgi:hypothetical protein
MSLKNLIANIKDPCGKGYQMKKVFILALLASAFATFSVAHSGGTDSRGCHTDHKTGVYHCH